MDYQALSDEELVRECAKSSNEASRNAAWAEFRQRFHRYIVVVVIKACYEWSKSHQICEDLIQDIYLKLCAHNCALLANFNSRHENAFLGFLKTVAANVVFDHFRAQHANKRSVANTVSLDEAVSHNQSGYGDPEAAEMNLFFDDVNRVLRKRGDGPTEQKERTIFWLYYRQGFTAKQIASIPAMNLSTKGVESVINRLTIFVRKALGFDQGGTATAGN